MADGAAKEMAKLNLLYNQKVRAAQGNAEKLLAIQKWYEREAAKITPEGKLASGMSEADRTYEMQNGFDRPNGDQRRKRKTRNGSKPNSHSVKHRRKHLRTTSRGCKLPANYPKANTKR